MPAPPRAAPSGAPCGKMGTTPLPNPSHGEANSNSQADTPAQEESQSCKSRSLPALLTLLSFLLKTVLIIPERSSGQAAFPASSFPAVPAAKRSRTMSDPPYRILLLSPAYGIIELGSARLSPGGHFTFPVETVPKRCPLKNVTDFPRASSYRRKYFFNF